MNRVSIEVRCISPGGDEEELVVEVDGINQRRAGWPVSDVFGPLPERYRVTYELAEDGDIEVFKSAVCGPVLRKGRNYFVACFIPREWVGQRVRRTMEPL